MKNMGSLRTSSYMTSLSWFLDCFTVLSRFDRKDS